MDVREALYTTRAMRRKFAGLVTLGYPTGHWGVAPRRPVHEVSYRNHWGTPAGFEVPEPLWSPE